MPIRPATRYCAAALTGAALLQTTALAQIDKDWRKLRDPARPVFAEPFFGPSAARDGQAGGFPASNVTLLAWLPLNQFPGGQRAGNDCWGYVSPSGREYILMGLQNGFSVLEVTNPTAPTQIGYIPGSTSAWRDIKVIGRYAYGVSEGGLGIQVIDLAGVDSGSVRHVGNVMRSGHTTTHNIVANPDSGFLYLCGANIANGGLVAVSLDDPEDPRIVGAWSTRYVHDAQVVTYTEGPYAGREIAFCFTGGRGLDVVDVTDKNNMFRIGGDRYSGVRYAHQGWLTEDRRHLLLNDEMDEGSVYDVTTTHVFDVSDPADPRRVTTFTSGSASTDHNLYVVGDIVYQANYMSGLRVFDISDPFNAEEIAFLDTSPDRDAPGYHGAWSTYPFLPSGTVAVSDIERGLFLLRLGEAGLGFTFPEGLPEMLDPGLPRAVTAQVDADGVEVDPGSVALVLEGRGEIPMSDLGGGLYRAELPAGECFDEYEFHFTASDTDGLVYMHPFNAPIEGGFTAMVRTGEETPFADDFNEDRGWGVDNSEVSEGGWARVIPERGNALEPDSDADGSGMAYVTGATPGESLRGGPALLTSPAFDLSDSPHARLEYAYWFNVDGNLAPNMMVEVSGDGGATWVAAANHGRAAGWRRHSVRPASHVSPGPDVRVRFRVSNVVGMATVEAGIDDVRLVAPVCDGCLADYNGDGAVDTQDVLAYLNDFTGSTNEGDPDLNGDGEVNTLDFLLFLNLYVEGCD
jgi:choice-of-anchor B domain-containing protein